MAEAHKTLGYVSSGNWPTIRQGRLAWGATLLAFLGAFEIVYFWIPRLVLKFGGHLPLEMSTRRVLSATYLLVTVGCLLGGIAFLGSAVRPARKKLLVFCLLYPV